MTNNQLTDRKTIAVILADTEGPYNNEIWSQVQSASRKSGVNLIAFEGRALEDFEEKQHNLIFDLATRVKCDGYLLFSSLLANFVDRDTLVDFTRLFTSKPVPAISVSIDIPGAVSMLIDGKQGMMELVEHLINVHGYRRFAFINGPDANDEAIERFQIFQDILTKYNIEIEANLILPGDFSPRAGYLGAQRLYENGLMPVDCIICANDEMAMGVYLFWREQVMAGVDVPLCHVTGFDNTRSAQISRPGLTTITQPFNHMIQDSLTLLRDGISPDQPTPLYYPTELVLRDSCGCPSSTEDIYSDELFFKSVRNYRVHQFMQTFSMAELFEKASLLFTECGIGDCYIVLYDKLVVYPNTKQVPKTSHLIYAWQDGRNQTSRIGNESFQTADLLPESCFNSRRNRNFLVKPLFFTNEHLGYMVFEPIGEDTRNYEPIRGQLSNSLKIISLLIEQNEMSRRLAEAVAELQRHNEKLNVLSLQDELTGLYNRRGFFKAAGDLVRRETSKDTNSLLIFADIDKMKLINDVYGHAAGDTALRMTSSVLRMAVREDDIVARMGGDEFVILARQMDDKNIAAIRERIQRMLDNYNEGSGNDWNLSLSLGIVSFTEGVKANLERLIQEADKALYIEKKQKKNQNI